MNSKQRLGLAVVASAIFFVSSQSDGALNAYMTIKGQKQGLIKGGVIQKGREGKIMVIAMNYEVNSPRDPATGQATQRGPIHRPFTVTVEWDQATPDLYTALFTNELLPEVTVDFYAPNPLGTAGGAGVEYNHMTIRLTNANISTIASRMLNNKNPELMRYKEYAEVSFVYQKIEITHNLSKNSAVGELSGKGGLTALLLLDPSPAELSTTPAARLSFH